MSKLRLLPSKSLIIKLITLPFVHLGGDAGALLFVRMARFLRKEDEFVPILRQQSDVIPGRLYSHFGRILLAVRNPDPVTTHYYRSHQDSDEEPYEISQREFNQVILAKSQQAELPSERRDKYLLGVVTHKTLTGDKCSICACTLHGLPCHCYFADGSLTGYYRLIYTAKQYSDNPV